MAKKKSTYVRFPRRYWQDNPGLPGGGGRRICCLCRSGESAAGFVSIEPDANGFDPESTPHYLVNKPLPVNPGRRKERTICGRCLRILIENCLQQQSKSQPHVLNMDQTPEYEDLVMHKPVPKEIPAVVKKFLRAHAKKNSLFTVRARPRRRVETGTPVAVRQGDTTYFGRVHSVDWEKSSATVKLSASDERHWGISELEIDLRDKNWHRVKKGNF